MNRLLEEDIQSVVDRCAGFRSHFENKIFLITGATGLIGSTIVNSLLKMNDEFGAGIRIIVTTRNIEKAKEEFGDSVVIKLSNDSIEERIDYIVHCAAPTQSKFFVEKPVETMDAVILDTRKMLEIAREKHVEKFLYVSSMEAYGTILTDKRTNESELGFIPLDSARSSYSEGKRVAELYAYAFAKEYGVPTVSARLAMCFGAGIRKDDNRVHKSFCENALAGQDIIMKSSGETIVNYIYSTDAVVALLTLLVKGKNGEVYNVAGSSRGETIYDMAKIIAGFGNVGVKKEIQSNSAFAPDNKMVLDNSKMKGLGWSPNNSLESSLRRFFEYFKEESN